MATVKFDFNNNFDGGASDRDAAEVRRVKKAIGNSYDKGNQDGFTQGQTEALNGIEAQASSTLERIEHALSNFFTQHAAIEDRIRKESVQLAIITAKKLAPAAMSEKPTAEIEAVVNECFNTCHTEENLVVRVPELLTENISGRINELKTRAGFEGDVKIISDPAMVGQDCRVEWNNGGSERSEANLTQIIDDLINNYIMAPSTEEHKEIDAEINAEQQ
jgi:flagellar assembly protein FliH